MVGLNAIPVPEATNKEVDIYRDTPVRLLGYANEVGESFRALIHVNWVYLSYAVAGAYVLADTYDKTNKMQQSLSNKSPEATSKLVITAVDTLLWQTLASVAIPGFTINRICALSLYTLARATKLKKKTRKWTTTGIGLGCIPFIVKPIDHFVDYAMDSTYRRVFPQT